VLCALRSSLGFSIDGFGYNRVLSNVALLKN
jgi:hypothetical protein